MIGVSASIPGDERFVARAKRLATAQIASGLSAKDSTLWGPEATAEASIRLGWTDDASGVVDLVETLSHFRNELEARGVSRVVLCGMGGSSLAPEVIATRQGLPLTILDSTHPDQVNKALATDLASTVVVVSSKSGTTVETATARVAFEDAYRQAGLDPIGHIVIVTDPDSPLHQEAVEGGYRVFLSDPTVGGRFSALTAFGLVPTALVGADVSTLVREASGAREVMTHNTAENPAILLASAMSDPAKPFLAIVPDGTTLPGFGDWVEQLVAESTGKDGVGVLPVVVSGANDPLLRARPKDVVFVGVTGGGDAVPGCDFTVSGLLGEQFVVWQWATAMAGFLLDINPFDQPDVESAKSAARSLLTNRPEPSLPDFTEAGVEVSALQAHLFPDDGLSGVWRSVGEWAGSDGYIALHVYADRETDIDWWGARDKLCESTSRPVTLGFGPRFLHSTGQFHKGGTPCGVFVQIEVSPTLDVEIPGYPFSFGQLIAAQAAGDRQVLADRGRPVVTLRVSDEAGLIALLASVESRAQ
jgi:glucose-6-phosphate isomerase